MLWKAARVNGLAGVLGPGRHVNPWSVIFWSSSVNVHSPVA